MSDGASKVLVVDDEPLFRELLSVHLGELGYEVLVAEDGESALETLREERPDLILLDLMLPGIGGLDVLDEVRSARPALDLPVVVVSSESGSPVIGEALRRGANDYVTKPFNFSLLSTRVATLLDMSQRARHALGGDLHVLEGQALPSPPAIGGYCEACHSAVEGDASVCGRCGAEEPSGGWPAVEESAHPLLGSLLGGSYFVEQFLGAGATGRVYRVRDLDLRRAFAAKVIHVAAEGAHDAEALRARVASEARALAQVTNPHVVRIQRVVRVTRDTFALVTDFVDGVTLDAHLERVGPLSPSDALRIAWQVAQGLSEAHALGMVHRDIKPSNIMLEPLPAGAAFARLLDFGIVAMTGAEDAGPGFRGSPAYASPEQILGAELDGRADMYSLGATLFHMLTGRPPYVTHPMALLVQHCTAPVPSLLDHLEPDAKTEAINEVVSRMLAKEAEERYEGLVDVVRAFDRILAVR